MPMANPVEMTDDELASAIRRTKDVAWSHNDLVNELERRSRDRQSMWQFRLSVVTTITAVITATVALGAFVISMD